MMYLNEQTGTYENAKEHFGYEFEHSWSNYIPDFGAWLEENMLDQAKAEADHVIEYDYESCQWYVNNDDSVDLWDYVTDYAEEA